MAQKFTTVDIINKLKKRVAITYSRFIAKGITIEVNDQSLEPFPLEVRYDENFKPARHTEEYKGVTIDIICGISPGMEKRTAYEVGRRGWNLFCNNRLILVDDQSETTGWTGKDGMLPKYHQIFNEFSGFVFLSSNDPANLPLNTSKTALLTSSHLYVYVLDKMVSAAKPVTKYLSQKYQPQKSESDAIDKNIQTTAKKEKDTSNVPIEKLERDTKFVAPKRRLIKQATITYKKPKSLVDKVKDHMGVSSNKEVGSDTFDFYVDFEDIG